MTKDNLKEIEDLLNNPLEKWNILAVRRATQLLVDELKKVLNYNEEPIGGSEDSVQASDNIIGRER
jgi:hypothetical protein